MVYTRFMGIFWDCLVLDLKPLYSLDGSVTIKDGGGGYTVENDMLVCSALFPLLKGGKRKINGKKRLSHRENTLVVAKHQIGRQEVLAVKCQTKHTFTGLI